MKQWIVICLVLLSGCSSLQLWKKPTKPQEKTMETIVAEAIADNLKTPAGRVAAISKDWLYKVLILMLVGGLVFWGITRSHWGWIVPSASIAGISMMIFFAKYAEIVALIVLGLGLAVIIYKAWEYQKERNEQTALNNKGE